MSYKPLTKTLRPDDAKNDFKSFDADTRIIAISEYFVQPREAPTGTLRPDDAKNGQLLLI